MENARRERVEGDVWFLRRRFASIGGRGWGGSRCGKSGFSDRRRDRRFFGGF